MKLFLISNGDYTTEADSKTAMQTVVIISANDPQDPRITEAVRYVAQVKNLAPRDIVVNELSAPFNNPVKNLAR